MMCIEIKREQLVDLGRQRKASTQRQNGKGAA